MVCCMFGREMFFIVVLSVFSFLIMVSIVLVMWLLRLVLKYFCGRLMCRLFSGFCRVVRQLFIGCLMLVEFFGLNLVIIFSISVQFLVVCVSGLFWLRLEVQVIMFQWEIWLQVGLILVRLVSVVGWWIELLVLVLVVVGSRCVVIVVVELLEELFGMWLRFQGFFIVLQWLDWFDEFMVNLFMFSLLRVMVLVVVSFLIMVVLQGEMKLLSIFELQLVCMFWVQNRFLWVIGVLSRVLFLLLVCCLLVVLVWVMVRLLVMLMKLLSWGFSCWM